VFIRNTFRPTAPGTEIGPDSLPGHGPVRAITTIGQLTLLTVQGKGMIGLPGMAARIFSTIAQEQINVLMISQSSSEYNICLVIEADCGARAAAALDRAFAHEIAQGLIEGIVGQDGVSIVAVIGAGMRGSARAAGRVFTLLSDEGIEVLAIAQGSSELNLSFVLPSAAADQAVRSIHREFDLAAAA
jgi:aspartokinase/homoserine dehydrogenase 1